MKNFGGFNIHITAIAMFCLASLASASLRKRLASLTKFSHSSSKSLVTYDTKNNSYINMLQKLFRNTMSFKGITLQQPSSRHTNANTETHRIFNARKQFFQHLFNASFPTQEKADSCKIIHVAGTKGKGSTVEYISSALIESKKCIGTFSSPHLHCARERIKCNRSLISKGELVKFGETALTLLESKDWVVVFDQLLSTALIYFG